MSVLNSHSHLVNTVPCYHLDKTFIKDILPLFENSALNSEMIFHTRL